MLKLGMWVYAFLLAMGSIWLFYMMLCYVIVDLFSLIIRSVFRIRNIFHYNKLAYMEKYIGRQAAINTDDDILSMISVGVTCCSALWAAFFIGAIEQIIPSLYLDVCFWGVVIINVLYLVALFIRYEKKFTKNRYELILELV